VYGWETTMPEKRLELIAPDELGIWLALSIFTSTDQSIKTYYLSLKATHSFSQQYLFIFALLNMCFNFVFSTFF
jgi:hypothetical protein